MNFTPISHFIVKIGLIVCLLAVTGFSNKSFAFDDPLHPSLDGKSFDGRIKATGLLGLVSVKGTLAFKEGLLFWTAKGSTEKASYTIEEVDGIIKFSARVPMDNGEHTLWSGNYNGETLTNVEALWKREKGDLIHDLLLPDEVTLKFTPKKIKQEDKNTEPGN